MNYAVIGSENGCVGKVQHHLQTIDPPARQRGRHATTNLQLCGSNSNLVMCLKWVPDTKTDWPTDRRS
jgi:hypothetical protein